jgi:hypothetical protein
VNINEVVSTVASKTSLVPDIMDKDSDNDNGDDELESREGSWPSVWTIEMWQEKKRDYPWLYCISGRIGCTYC